MDTLAPPPRITGHIRLELVVDTAAGVQAAARNGADRIELCAALNIGGVTPSLGLMRLAALSGCPTRAMIRPRGGDFTYSTDEIDLMRADIDAAKAAGMQGVVFGANLPSGELDEASLRVLCRHAKDQGLETGLHRSFDLTPDPLTALDVAMILGVNTILTSGGRRQARDGVATLTQLVERSAGRVEIMAGVGITAQNVADIVRLSGVRSLHASCSAPGEQPGGAANDRDWLRDYLRAGQKETSAAAILAMRQALESIDLPQGNGGRQ